MEFTQGLRSTEGCHADSIMGPAGPAQEKDQGVHRGQQRTSADYSTPTQRKQGQELDLAPHTDCHTATNDPLTFREGRHTQQSAGGQAKPTLKDVG